MTTEKRVALPEGLAFYQVIPGEPIDSSAGNAAQELDSDISGLLNLLTNPPPPVNEELDGEPAAPSKEQEPPAPAASSARIDEPPKISARTLHSARLQVRVFDLIASLALTALSGSMANYDRLKGTKKDLEELALIWGEICELEGIKLSPYISLIAGIGAVYAPAAVEAWQLRQQGSDSGAVSGTFSAPAPDSATTEPKSGRAPVMPPAPRKKGVKPGTKRGSYNKGGGK